MHYHNVCLEQFGYTFPEEVVTTAEIEKSLRPVYERLRLPEGRLELMTGIKERRFWKKGTLPSEKSILSVEKAIQQSGIDRQHIGALVHASVCRDYLEPATACVVHSQLDLPEECFLYDISNACLGFLSGMVQVANMIELGQIRAGIVVASEGSRELVETTINRLNTDTSFTRDSIKLAVASLTIGSGSVAVLLTDREISNTQNLLLGGVFRNDTTGAGLCQSGKDEAVAGEMAPFMQTDSETLLHTGIEVGAKTFEQFLTTLDWTRDDINKTVCHQIGAMQRKLMLSSLQLNPEDDYQTLEYLGNTGSVAVPITTAIAIENGHLNQNDNVAMLGIGSGINCVMLGVKWQQAPVIKEETVSQTVGVSKEDS